MTSKVVVDLSFGDSGKGSIVDRLVRDQPIHTVVRFNGGSQAAHHVVLPDGTWHQFSQFGSGTFTGCRTHLSRFMLVNPLRMVQEADELRAKLGTDPSNLMSIDGDCLLTTPYHQAMNRARERARGDNRHGSCGQGIGETVQYALETPTLAPRAGDICREGLLTDKLITLQRHALAVTGDNDPIMRSWSVRDLLVEYRAWAKRFRIVDGDHLARLHDIHPGDIVFEGAQGVLLDEWRGFHPYTTWSTTTPTNALTLADELGIEVEVLGVCRSYMTRHGNGPFPTEDPNLLKVLPEQHNSTGEFMGGWRVGHFDVPLLKYAIDCCERLDGLIITHVDRWHPVFMCMGYHESNGDPIILTPSETPDLTYQENLTAQLERARPDFGLIKTGREIARFLPQGYYVPPLYMTSHGPTWQDKIVAPHRSRSLA